MTEQKVYDAFGTLQQRWKYSSQRTPLSDRIKITTIASKASNANSDGMTTVSYVFKEPADARFGFSNPKAGSPIEELSYDENNVLRSRVLTEYVTKDFVPTSWNNVLARRDLRVKRRVSIMFEPGSEYALATLSETDYDDNGSSDPAYFSHLNVKKQKNYQYKKVLRGSAETSSLETIAGLFSADNPASVSETDYSYSPNYKERGIIGLPIETRVLNPQDPSEVLAKSKVVYDEPGQDYSMVDYGSTTGYQTPTGTYSYLRGNPTTKRIWNKDTNTWIDTHTQFDNFGNVRKQWDTSGDQSRYLEYEYDPFYKYAYVTKTKAPAPDPSDTTGTSQTSSVEMLYDFNTGLPMSIKDDFGQITTTEYNDALLRPTKVNPVVVNGQPTGPVTVTVYNDDARTVEVRKQLEAGVTNKWDEATTYMDSFGRPIKSRAKDSQGDVIVETKYDLLGRVQMVSNPYRQGDTIYWNLTEYDAAGRVKQTREPTANQDPANPTGNILGTTTYGISTVQNYVDTVVTSTDASGRKGRSLTNALGQLVRVDESKPIPGSNDFGNIGDIETPSQPTFYTYDAYGKMVKVSQGVQDRFFKYDSLGRLIRVNQPEQDVNIYLDISGDSRHWTAGFVYDILGNVVRATDANGVNIINEYDKANRVIRRCYTNPNVHTIATGCSAIAANDLSTNTPTVNFLYDGKGLDALQTPNWAKGKLTRVDNGISQTRNTLFDNFGRITESKQITDGTTYTSKYGYNLSGALVQETYPSGRVVKNEFESDGDLAKVISKQNGTRVYQPYASGFSYTPDGKIEKLKLGNNLWEAASFNNRLQVTELRLGKNAACDDPDCRWRLGYEYGELNDNGSVNTAKNTGNIAKQTESFSGLVQPFIQTYKYDSLYRLTEGRETKNGSQTWIQQLGYDRYGNRTSLSQNVGGINLNTTPAIDPNTNRFTSTSFHFDKNGNLTQDIGPNNQSRTVIFNGDNKQSEVKDANGITIGKYFYDGEGKRVKKVTDTEMTVFVYSSGKLVAEYSTAPLPANPTVNYTATDMLGSPRVITNSLGDVVSRRDFMPFGEELFADGQNRATANNYSLTGQDSVRKRFTGYEKDPETGLDFAEARMYDNRYGRFTAIDPLIASGKSANPQTFNRYVYVMNSPLKLKDSTGLQAASPKDDLKAGCSSDCIGRINTKTNTATGIGAPLINLIVDVVSDVADSLNKFFQFGGQQITDTIQFGGSPDQTSRVLGNKGFTQRQFFDTSNQFIGEVGDLNLKALSFIDPAGQGSLPLTTFNWQNGRASNFEMGATTFGAILGPLSFGESSFASKAPRAYSVAFEITLDVGDLGASRMTHVRRANEALFKTLEGNASFRSQFENVIPGATDFLRTTNFERSPAGWNWHHAVSDSHTPLGTLQLVPKSQHRVGFFQSMFHPNGSGGWAELRRFRQPQ